MEWRRSFARCVIRAFRARMINRELFLLQDVEACLTQIFVFIIALTHNFSLLGNFEGKVAKIRGRLSKEIR